MSSWERTRERKQSREAVGGRTAKLLQCVGRVNILPPADVCVMGTWGLAELGYLHGKILQQTARMYLSLSLSWGPFCTSLFF